MVPEPADVVRELIEVMTYACALEIEYSYLHPSGFVGNGGRTDEPVRHVGASDPTGEIVTSKEASEIRYRLRSAARQIHQANLSMRSALDDLKSLQRGGEDVDWDRRLSKGELKTLKAHQQRRLQRGEGVC